MINIKNKSLTRTFAFICAILTASPTQAGIIDFLARCWWRERIGWQLSPLTQLTGWRLHQLLAELEGNTNTATFHPDPAHCWDLKLKGVTDESEKIKELIKSGAPAARAGIRAASVAPIKTIRPI